jgi:CRISPR-associated protein Cas5d
MEPTPQVIEVWADLACFARPELKVERWSYPCPTPSAARGVYDSIYVKPTEFRWQVTRIEVLSEPAYIALRRNEVKDVASVNAITQWMTGEAEPEPIWADGDRDLLGTDEKGRTQRQTMALKDVRYRMHAYIRPWPGFESKLTGFEHQFRRRAATGKCFQQPYLGAREMVAFFKLADHEAAPAKHWTESQDLGWMLYDVFDLSRPGTSVDRPAISVFHARVENGSLRVPEYASPEVHKNERSPA